MKDARIHIVHVLNRLGVGGMENVVVQLINELPTDRFRHSVIAITDILPSVAERVRVPDVGLHALDKQPGQPFRLYPRMYRLLRSLQPDVWHSCNLAALEFSPVAWLAGIPLRVHAEHGLELAELSGRQSVYRRVRRLFRDFVHLYVAVSAQIARDLHTRIGVSERKIRLIGNGVDLSRFRPVREDDPIPNGYPFRKGEHWVIGTVGRQEAIKNPLLLVDAFIRLARTDDAQSQLLRLAMIGDGSLHGEIRARLCAAGLEDRCWLPGNRDDVADILRRFDCFVLPSVSEGTSCTLQEAVATGLSIVATDVGGNRAILDHGRIGRLVVSEDPEALAEALTKCRREGMQDGGAEVRHWAESEFSLASTVREYARLFDKSAAAQQEAKR